MKRDANNNVLRPEVVFNRFIQKVYFSAKLIDATHIPLRKIFCYAQSSI